MESLQQALRQQATRDFLTGLFDRRQLNEVLPSMLAMAHRDKQALSVVIIDLDHFKTVNDALGHAAGDQLLTDFGRLLDAQCRKERHRLPLRRRGVLPADAAHAGAGRAASAWPC